jgi:apolipoprotein N-acyltransferase
MSKSNNFYSPLITLLSGVLMGLTVAPFNAWFLAWFTLAPLWVLIFNSAYKTKLSKLQLAGAWGVGYYGATLSWITGLHPLTWMGVSWLSSIAIAIFAWFFVTLWGTLLTISWATVFFWISQKLKASSFTPILRVLIGTTLWCVLENIWTNGPLWWSSLSYTQSPHNLVILHLGQLSGASTITASILVINGLVAEIWIKTRNNHKYKKYYLIPLILFIILHLIGFNLYNKPLAKPQEAAIKIGIIQGNIPNRIKFDYYGLRRAIEGYTTGYLKLVDQGVNAVLTPEGALPFFSRNILDSSLVAAVKEKGVVAWIGGFAERPNSNTYANSLFTITSDGNIYSRFEKSKLVPLGEYVPFEEILGKLIRRLSVVTARQVPGATNQIFDTPFGRVIAGICYESAFPEQFRRQASLGGEFIITASNNDPYSKAMQTQHHALDTMRAIETDRWAARATNTGLSAFVNPHGKTLWISGHNTYETHAETIYRQKTQTMYVRWGDWLTPLLIVLTLLGLIVNIKPRRLGGAAAQPNN